MQRYRDDEPFYYEAEPVDLDRHLPSFKKTLLILAGCFVWACVTALGLRHGAGPVHAFLHAV